MYLISRQPPIPSIRGTTRNSGSIPSTLPLFPSEEWPESIVEVFLEQQASHLVVSTQDQPFVPAPAEGKETHVDPMLPEPKIRIHIVMSGCRTNQTIDVDGAVPASHLPPFIVAFQLAALSQKTHRCNNRPLTKSRHLTCVAGNYLSLRPSGRRRGNYSSELSGQSELPFGRRQTVQRAGGLTSAILAWP